MICKTIHGEEVQVDPEDYHQYVSGHRFRLSSSGYVEYSTRKDGMHHKMLHRIIMGDPPGQFIDHINRDKLDNRRENLRTATKSQNNSNTGVRSDNTSGFKGVNWDKRRNKWVARVQVNGKPIHLGYYKHLIKAGMISALARIMVHGEFAGH